MRADTGVRGLQHLARRYVHGHLPAADWRPAQDDRGPGARSRRAAGPGPDRREHGWGGQRAARRRASARCPAGDRDFTRIHDGRYTETSRRPGRTAAAAHSQECGRPRRLTATCGTTGPGRRGQARGAEGPGLAGTGRWLRTVLATRSRATAAPGASVSAAWRGGPARAELAPPGAGPVRPGTAGTAARSVTGQGRTVRPGRRRPGPPMAGCESPPTAGRPIPAPIAGTMMATARSVLCRRMCAARDR